MKTKSKYSGTSLKPNQIQNNNLYTLREQSNRAEQSQTETDINHDQLCIAIHESTAELISAIA